MRRPDDTEIVPEDMEAVSLDSATVAFDARTVDIASILRYSAENSPLGMVVVEGPDHIVRYVNPAFSLLCAKPASDLLGRSYRDAVPESRENGCLALLERVYATKLSESIDHQEHGVGSGIYWSYTTWVALNAAGTPAGVLIQVTDTTGPMRIHKAAVAVNEALLISGVEQNRIAEVAVALNIRLQRAMRETHHRVKNNLQVVSAMADMQIDAESPTVPTSALQRIGEHVRTLATLHDLLTEHVAANPENKVLDARTVLNRLRPVLQAALGGRRLHFDIAHVILPVHQCEAISLIVSELTSNIVKHAAGEMFVALECTAGTAVLRVYDDGEGFPEGFDPQEAAHTGLELVMSMARADLRGEALFSNRPEGGACVSITFPVPPVS